MIGSHGAAGGPEDPLFVVVGGLHGNEPAGVEAVARVLRTLEREELPLRGKIVGVTGNRAALASGERFLVEDLNRIWTPERCRELTADPGGREGEERELVELLGLFEGLLAEHRGPVLVLDLHSTSADGSPFAIAPDTLGTRPVALELGVPLLLGLEERLEGTLLAWFGRRGHRALCLEGGQSDLPSTVDHHEAAIWITLSALGMVSPGALPELPGHRARLAETAWGLPRVVEVRFRFSVAESDRFEMVPGYTNFHFVSHGDELARLGGRAVPSPFDGLLVMPRYQGQGADGFFLGVELGPTWLAVSRFLRSLGLPALLRWFPGLHPSREVAGALTAERFWTKGRPLALLHLLGFRRRGLRDGRLLFVRRPEPS